MVIRALTMLNESGDTTIAWTEDRDDEMEKLIQQKMDAGCTFFLIEPRFGGRQKLKSAKNAGKHRMLAIPGDDIARFLGLGDSPGMRQTAPSKDATEIDDNATAAIVKSPSAPTKVIRRGKSAKEVAQSESVGVAPRRGG